jgi:hypothetical protein
VAEYRQQLAKQASTEINSEALQARVTEHSSARDHEVKDMRGLRLGNESVRQGRSRRSPTSQQLVAALPESVTRVECTA